MAVTMRKRLTKKVLISLFIVITIPAMGLFSATSFALEAGQYRVQATWGTNYLKGTDVDWSPAVVAPLNISWRSQIWYFEAISGTTNQFRIRSQYPGDNYLTCGGNDWDDVNVAPLNASWFSQRWIVEPEGDNYRIRCSWTNDGNAKYLHGSNEDWVNVRGAPLYLDWYSQVWKIQSTDNTSPPPPPTDNPGAGAIAVGFENHANNLAYNKSAQEKDWNVGFSTNDMDTYTSVKNNEARSGSNSLQVRYPDNVQIGAGAQYLIPPETEYYLSYWIKFDSNFGFNGDFPGTSGGKLPGLASSGLCSGGATCTGTNGFTSRYMWREDGRAVLYLYHMNKPGTYGEDIQLRDENGSDIYYPTGRWFKMTQRVRINDGNQSNGSVEVWLDNRKVLSRNNLKFVNNGNKIDSFYFSTFHGGSGSTWWPRYTTYAYFDDFIVSTNRSDVGL